MQVDNLLFNQDKSLPTNSPYSNCYEQLWSLRKALKDLRVSVRSLKLEHKSTALPMDDLEQKVIDLSKELSEKEQIINDSFLRDSITLEAVYDILQVLCNITKLWRVKSSDSQQLQKKDNKVQYLYSDQSHIKALVKLQYILLSAVTQNQTLDRSFQSTVVHQSLFTSIAFEYEDVEMLSYAIKMSACASAFRMGTTPDDKALIYAMLPIQLNMKENTYRSLIDCFDPSKQNDLINQDVTYQLKQEDGSMKTYTVPVAQVQDKSKTVAQLTEDILEQNHYSQHQDDIPNLKAWKQQLEVKLFWCRTATDQHSLKLSVETAILAMRQFIVNQLQQEFSQACPDYMLNRDHFMTDALKLLKVSDNPLIVKMIINLFYHRLGKKNLIKSDDIQMFTQEPSEEGQTSTKCFLEQLAEQLSSIKVTIGSQNEESQEDASMKDETSAFSTTAQQSSIQITRTCKAGPIKQELMLDIEVQKECYQFLAFILHLQAQSENPLMDKIKKHLRTVILTNYLPLNECSDNDTYVAVYHPRFVSFALQNRLAQFVGIRQWTFTNENRINFKQIEHKITQEIQKYLSSKLVYSDNRTDPNQVDIISKAQHLKSLECLLDRIIGSTSMFVHPIEHFSTYIIESDLISFFQNEVFPKCLPDNKDDPLQAEIDSIMIRFVCLIDAICSNELATVSKFIEDGLIPAIFNNLKQRIPCNSLSIQTIIQFMATISTPEKGQVFIKDYIDDVYVKLFPLCLDVKFFEALRNINNPCLNYFNSQQMIKLIRNMPDFKQPTTAAIFNVVKQMQTLNLTCIKVYYKFIQSHEDTNFTKIDVLGHDKVEQSPEFELLHSCFIMLGSLNMNENRSLFEGGQRRELIQLVFNEPICNELLDLFEIMSQVHVSHLLVSRHSKMIVDYMHQSEDTQLDQLRFKIYVERFQRSISDLQQFAGKKLSLVKNFDDLIKEDADKKELEPIENYNGKNKGAVLNKKLHLRALVKVYTMYSKIAGNSVSPSQQQKLFCNFDWTEQLENMAFLYLLVMNKKSDMLHDLLIQYESDPSKAVDLSILTPEKAKQFTSPYKKEESTSTAKEEEESFIYIKDKLSSRVETLMRQVYCMSSKTFDNGALFPKIYNALSSPPHRGGRHHQQDDAVVRKNLVAYGSILAKYTDQFKENDFLQITQDQQFREIIKINSTLSILTQFKQQHLLSKAALVEFYNNGGLNKLITLFKQLSQSMQEYEKKEFSYQLVVSMKQASYLISNILESMVNQNARQGQQTFSLEQTSEPTKFDGLQHFYCNYYYTFIKALLDNEDYQKCITEYKNPLTNKFQQFIVYLLIQLSDGFSSCPFLKDGYEDKAKRREEQHNRMGGHHGGLESYMRPDQRRQQQQQEERPPTEDEISQVTSLGFDRESATAALEMNYNNVSNAVEMLLQGDPAIYTYIHERNERQQIARLKKETAADQLLEFDLIENEEVQAEKVIAVDFFKEKLQSYQFKSFQTALDHGLQGKLFTAQDIMDIVQKFSAFARQVKDFDESQIINAFKTKFNQWISNLGTILTKASEPEPAEQQISEAEVSEKNKNEEMILAVEQMDLGIQLINMFLYQTKKPYKPYENTIINCLQVFDKLINYITNKDNKEKVSTEQVEAIEQLIFNSLYTYINFISALSIKIKVKVSKNNKKLKDTSLSAADKSAIEKSTQKTLMSLILLIQPRNLVKTLFKLLQSFLKKETLISQKKPIVDTCALIIIKLATHDWVQQQSNQTQAFSEWQKQTVEDLLTVYTQIQFTTKTASIANKNDVQLLQYLMACSVQNCDQDIANQSKLVNKVMYLKAQETSRSKTNKRENKEFEKAAKENTIDQLIQKIQQNGGIDQTPSHTDSEYSYTRFMKYFQFAVTKNPLVEMSQSLENLKNVIKSSCQVIKRKQSSAFSNTETIILLTQGNYKITKDTAILNQKKLQELTSNPSNQELQNTVQKSIENLNFSVNKQQAHSINVILQHMYNGTDNLMSKFNNYYKLVADNQQNITLEQFYGEEKDEQHWFYNIGSVLELTANLTRIYPHLTAHIIGHKFSDGKTFPQWLLQDLVPVQLTKIKQYSNTQPDKTNKQQATPQFVKLQVTNSAQHGSSNFQTIEKMLAKVLASLTGYNNLMDLDECLVKYKLRSDIMNECLNQLNVASQQQQANTNQDLTSRNILSCLIVIQSLINDFNEHEYNRVLMTRENFSNQIRLLLVKQNSQMPNFLDIIEQLIKNGIVDLKESKHSIMISKIITILNAVCQYIEHFKELKSKRDQLKKDKLRKLRQLKQVKSALKKQPSGDKGKQPQMIQASEDNEQPAEEQKEEQEADNSNSNNVEMQMMRAEEQIEIVEQMEEEEDMLMDIDNDEDEDNENDIDENDPEGGFIDDDDDEEMQGDEYGDEYDDDDYASEEDFQLRAEMQGDRRRPQRGRQNDIIGNPVGNNDRDRLPVWDIGRPQLHRGNQYRAQQQQQQIDENWTQEERQVQLLLSNLRDSLPNGMELGERPEDMGQVMNRQTIQQLQAALKHNEIQEMFNIFEPVSTQKIMSIANKQKKQFRQDQYQSVKKAEESSFQMAPSHHPFEVIGRNSLAHRFDLDRDLNANSLQMIQEEIAMLRERIEGHRMDPNMNALFEPLNILQREGQSMLFGGGGHERPRAGQMHQQPWEQNDQQQNTFVEMIIQNEQDANREELQRYTEATREQLDQLAIIEEAQPQQDRDNIEPPLDPRVFHRTHSIRESDFNDDAMQIDLQNPSMIQIIEENDPNLQIVNTRQTRPEEARAENVQVNSSSEPQQIQSSDSPEQAQAEANNQALQQDQPQAQSENIEMIQSQEQQQQEEAPREEQQEVSAFEVQASKEDASMHEESKEENKEPAEPKQEQPSAEKAEEEPKPKEQEEASQQPAAQQQEEMTFGYPNSVLIANDLDPAILNELPEELRAELLSSIDYNPNQHAQQQNAQPQPQAQLQEQQQQPANNNANVEEAKDEPAQQQQQQQPAAQSNDFGIDPAFLESIPEEMRREILENESLRNQNLGVESQQVQMEPQRQPEQMDIASIIATVQEPGLRREMLSNLDEATINTLPSGLRAEAIAARADIQRDRQRERAREREMIHRMNQQRIPPNAFMGDRQGGLFGHHHHHRHGSNELLEANETLINQAILNQVQYEQDNLIDQEQLVGQLEQEFSSAESLVQNIFVILCNFKAGQCNLLGLLNGLMKIRKIQSGNAQQNPLQMRNKIVSALSLLLYGSMNKNSAVLNELVKFESKEDTDFIKISLTVLGTIRLLCQGNKKLIQYLAKSFLNQNEQQVPVYLKNFEECLQKHQLVAEPLLQGLVKKVLDKETKLGNDALGRNIKLAVYDIFKLFSQSIQDQEGSKVDLITSETAGNLVVLCDSTETDTKVHSVAQDLILHLCKNNMHNWQLISQELNSLSNKVLSELSVKMTEILNRFDKCLSVEMQHSSSSPSKEKEDIQMKSVEGSEKQEQADKQEEVNILEEEVKEEELPPIVLQSQHSQVTEQIKLDENDHEQLKQLLKEQQSQIMTLHRMLGVIASTFKSMSDIEEDEEEVRSEMPDRPQTKEQKQASADRKESLKSMTEFFNSKSIVQNVKLVNQLLMIIQNTDMDLGELVKTHVICVFNSYFPEILDLSNKSNEELEKAERAKGGHKILMRSLSKNAKNAHNTNNMFKNVQNVTERLQQLGMFCVTNKKVLNKLLSTSLRQLVDRYGVVKYMPNLLDFDNKREYFKNEIAKLSRPHQHDRIALFIRRDDIFMDSYAQINNRSPNQMKGPLEIAFTGERGQDVGGLTRDFFIELSREMFNPNYSLFNLMSNGVSYFPNPNSGVVAEHLQYFKFIGRIIGKALFDGCLLECYFAKPLYKMMIGDELCFEDLEEQDHDFFKNLKWSLEQDITVLGLTFSIDEEYFGRSKQYELIPNGAKIDVTNENKEEYIEKLAYYKMYLCIKQQVDAFLTGFHEIIPKQLVSIFNYKEIELLISGMPNFDINDLKKNTDYNGYNIDSPQIVWFWELIEGLEQQDVGLFLQFVTGSSKIPLDGFKALQGMRGPHNFTISRIKTNDIWRLPQGHTCFNTIDLPEYPTKQLLCERVLFAIRETKGFGFA